jgi:hypothetical protein
LWFIQEARQTAEAVLNREPAKLQRPGLSRKPSKMQRLVQTGSLPNCSTVAGGLFRRLAKLQSLIKTGSWPNCSSRWIIQEAAQAGLIFEPAKLLSPSLSPWQIIRRLAKLYRLV